ncbi:MAG: hypothetical protein A3J76_00965 [Candidatus Moranbacteria bacterium RBG_13_45_13]|nr:MAG: hypothetical protein A3J76_00965 [Candidatus Moranbacteria bacterium RBG_13_45_13]
MKAIYALLGFLLICGLAWIGYTNSKLMEIEKKKLSIEEEKHIDNLYSIYQENMSTCKKNAIDQGKDESYVKENCVAVINNSVIANWLKDRGYGNLIKD